MQDRIQDNLRQEFPDAELNVVVDGNRCLVQIVSEDFEGVMQVKRQQRVYRCLNELLSSGELHAVTIQAKTPSETLQG